ncbi:hypothetical protein ZIOFF_031169 [Zingiber officinale]|uniref:Acidic leucine-rich nuclear phosphoprotein 32-related protein n=1 Tax=Zingiber officinale TaxID=94328 RepID=A0A8J5GWL4_ZINOF|nr:hypothetical protein ZIOFF_031169 [Zingiber officinale]
MDEAWERAVEAAIGAQAESSSSASPPRSLTLDGSVKCLHGRLPPPEILERYQSLEVLSIANIGASSLEKFPRLRNLQRLILSDNRIGGGLEFLVEAGLDSLRDLDLSNNRIQFLEDLSPLAQLRLVSLDLYECPVTKIKDYRSRVFGMIRTLKYLDKLDADENERPESDEEDEEEDEDEDDEEEDPGSGEVDGEELAERMINGVGSSTAHTIVDVDEEEDSDAEEDTETGIGADANGLERGYHASNAFRVAPIRAASVEREEGQDEEDDDVDEYEEEDLGEEIDVEEEDEEDDDVVEVHDIGDSEEDDDGVDEGEEELDEEDEEDEDGDIEEDQDVPDDEDDGLPGSSGRFINVEGEIDGHEQGEGDEDENGEIGQEDVQEVDDDRFSEEGDGEDEFEDDDNGGEYLVQQIAQPPFEEAAGSDALEEDEDDEVDNNDDGVEHLHRNGRASPPHASSSRSNKRRRKDNDSDEESEEEQLHNGGFFPSSYVVYSELTYLERLANARKTFSWVSCSLLISRVLATYFMVHLLLRGGDIVFLHTLSRRWWRVAAWGGNPGPVLERPCYLAVVAVAVNFLPDPLPENSCSLARLNRRRSSELDEAIRPIPIPLPLPFPVVR